MVEVLFVIGAYLFGSLPVLHWIGKARGFDLNPKEEDLHQALWRKVGFTEGMAGILWDALKGPIPPLLAWWFNFDVIVVGLAALAVTAGQMWPIFSGFYGKERGNTTGLGAAFGVAPLTLGYAMIPVFIGGNIRIVLSMRKKNKTTAERLKLTGTSDAMPLAMLAAFMALPLGAWQLHKESAIIWIFVAFLAMIVLRRLTADLKKDIDAYPHLSLTSILKNRFLYDRSYR